MTVTHAPNPQGGVWVNIGNVSPLLPGMPEIQVVGYTRAPYWAEKAATYATGFTAWEQNKLAQQVTGAANASKAKSADPAGSFDDLPAALDGSAHGIEDDDLPFS